MKYFDINDNEFKQCSLNNGEYRIHFVESFKSGLLFKWLKSDYIGFKFSIDSKYKVKLNLLTVSSISLNIQIIKASFSISCWSMT